jgi:uncharacterized surface protein with fasciclin (FAS1) repeats
MRKLVIVLAFLLVVVLVAAPVMAQERASIAEFLINDGRFGTLLAAVGAAGLSDALNSDGPLTILAPTDDAFAALPLGAVSYLLDNPDVLASVLTAHALPGQYTVRTLVTGPTIESAGGEPITFALESGVLSANGVRISNGDQVVSNGVIHILDGVIIPAAVQEALAAATTFVRVAHFSPDAGPVDIIIDDQRLLEGVTFGTISDWVPVVTGVYTIQLAEPGSDDFLRTTTTRIPGGAHITVAAIGVVEINGLQLRFIPEDYSPLADGQARVTVFHAIQNAPAVDVLADGGVLIRLLGYPGTLGDNDGVDIINVAAASYDIQVVPSGATEPVILDLPDVRFEAGNYYLVAAIGTPANPSVALKATPAEAE